MLISPVFMKNLKKKVNLFKKQFDNLKKSAILYGVVNEDYKKLKRKDVIMKLRTKKIFTILKAGKIWLKVWKKTKAFINTTSVLILGLGFLIKKLMLIWKTKQSLSNADIPLGVFLKRQQSVLKSWILRNMNWLNVYNKKS